MSELPVRLVTSSELQHLLNVGRTTIHKWMREGKLRPLSIGKQLLFREDDVMEFMGLKPRLRLWIDANRQHASTISRTCVPHYTAEYLPGSPQPDYMRVKILDATAAANLDHFNRMKKERNTVIVSNPEEAWYIHSVRSELHPAGYEYLALDLKRME